MSYCRHLNRQSNMKPGGAKRMENVFRPFVCTNPHRNRELDAELGASLAAARQECRRRCPARFGLSAEPPSENPKVDQDKNE